MHIVGLLFYVIQFLLGLFGLSGLLKLDGINTRKSWVLIIFYTLFSFLVVWLILNQGGS